MGPGATVRRRATIARCVNPVSATGSPVHMGAEQIDRSNARQTVRVRGAIFRSILSIAIFRLTMLPRI
jgi:hypothetical protein